jgi:hypothetical protein
MNSKFRRAKRKHPAHIGDIVLSLDTIVLDLIIVWPFPQNSDNLEMHEIPTICKYSKFRQFVNTVNIKFTYYYYYYYYYLVSTDCLTSLSRVFLERIKLIVAQRVKKLRSYLAKTFSSELKRPTKLALCRTG